MTTCSVVPDDDTFHIVRGHDGLRRLDTIYIYEADSESWLEVNATLPRPTMTYGLGGNTDINIFPSC